ncbi:MAG: 16S rRNA (cytosine(967)-C(5))-methyltransferase RsmB [Myxococcota bacterium]|nr:16S rRNA (cytosine(967)-C(5))-methyltransferase RsmB [Myxococcota bacterium]
MSAREVARRVLDRVEKGGAWATLALDAELSRSGLDERDRRLASELVYGVLRHRARIDHALAAHADLARTPPKIVTVLRVAAHQLLFLDRVPAYAAVDDAVQAARGVGGQKLSGFTNAVLRKITKTGAPPLPTELRARIEIEHSLPRWIVDELAQTVDAEQLPVIAAAFAQPPALVARVNLRKTTRDALAAELVEQGVTATPVERVPTALVLDGAGDPGKIASFLAGRWTIQDTGAQLVGQLAAPAAGMRILDACAGVGGKATHLAELADCAIDAADQSKTKLELCMQTALRLGLGGITPRVCDLTDPKAQLADAYDLIILDAPCSGLGVLRRHPDAKWRLPPDTVPRLAKLQQQLLDGVVARLAPGGTLVYSVCTFTRAEGPAQIAALVARSGLELVSEERTWPPEADAFYIARLVKPRATT